MQLEIITPVNVLYSDEISLVQLPGMKGSFEILKNHASIVSSLTKGFIKVIDSKKKTHLFEITGGVVECKSDNIIVLANEGKSIQEINY
jgi:F-type H+-transporting ATPase subunit epsilon